MAPVVESATGVSFNEELELWDGSKLVSVGAGLRSVKIAFVAFKVYAITLYVDPVALNARGSAAIHDSSVRRAVVIEMVRKVSSKEFAQNLRKSLTPRLPGEEKAVDQLETALGERNLEIGLRGIFASEPDGIIVGELALDGIRATYPDPSKRVYNENLRNAIFELYSDKNSITPDARNTWIKTADKLRGKLPT